MKRLMFDIGANEGNNCQFYLSQYSKIVCFEPNPQLFNHLNTRFFKNNQVIVDSRGLSNKNEDKLFKISNINTLSTFSDDWIIQSRFTGAYSWNESITVKTTTLDNIIKEYGIPNFVKIDVEGYELEVFQGLTSLLDNTIFSFEWVEEHYNTKLKQIYNLINNLGYKKFAFTHGDKPIAEENLVWVSWDNLDLHKDIIKERKQKFGMIYFKR